MPRHPDFRRNQVRLVLAQILGGIGVASGFAVGGLLAESLTGSTALAGFAQTASILGAGLVAIPLARVADRRGRGVALPLGYAIAATGGVAIVLAATTGQGWLFYLGMLLFGSATAAGLQARYAATDLAEPAHRGRAMSVVVWASTVGSVLGPNLSDLGAAVGVSLGTPPLAGPFVFGLVAFALAALASLGLRGRAPEGGPGTGEATPGPGVAESLRIVAGRPDATLGMAAVAGGHMMMVAVMVMTPVHMNHEGMSLTLVGIVISIHILGMYALSPVFGILVDRSGARRVIAAGLVLFLGSVVAAVLGGQSTLWVTVALALLGLGWSACLIAGSSLLSASSTPRDRLAIQGVSDSAMNLAAAGAAAAAGPLLALGGFTAVNGAAAVILCALTLVAVRARVSRPTPVP